MVYDTTKLPAPNAPIFLSSPSAFVSRVERSVVIACLTVSWYFDCCQVRACVLISDIAVLQLCLWDWLIMFADEVAMICEGERRPRRYILDGVYVVVR
jgi:hypothetical protein